MPADGLHMDLSCPHCSWALECNEAEILRRVTDAGLVKRNSQLTSPEVRELTLAFASRLVCPTCGHAGLHAVDSPDPEDSWPTAARCEICGQPIPPERLEVFPNARTCVACQRADDAGQAPRETEYCPQCGAPMALRKTQGTGITRYKLVCTAVPPCRS